MFFSFRGLLHKTTMHLRSRSCTSYPCNTASPGKGSTSTGESMAVLGRSSRERIIHWILWKNKTCSKPPTSKYHRTNILETCFYLLGGCAKKGFKVSVWWFHKETKHSMEYHGLEEITNLIWYVGVLENDVVLPTNDGHFIQLVDPNYRSSKNSLSQNHDTKL